MNNTRQNLMKATENYRNAIEAMKKEAIAFISSIEEKDLKRYGEHPSAFSVTLSTIRANNSILSPFYYDIATQKRELIEIIEKSEGASFMQTLANIAKTGKRVVKTGCDSYQKIYAPCVVEALKEFVLEEE